jgi:hypothetical protein
MHAQPSTQTPLPQGALAADSSRARPHLRKAAALIALKRLRDAHGAAEHGLSLIPGDQVRLPTSFSGVLLAQGRMLVMRPLGGCRVPIACLPACLLGLHHA